jgi:AICAR transformylase/IMP cyclohydrolase PurH
LVPNILSKTVDAKTAEKVKREVDQATVAAKAEAEAKAAVEKAEAVKKVTAAVIGPEHSRGLESGASKG